MPRRNSSKQYTPRWSWDFAGRLHRHVLPHALVSLCALAVLSAALHNIQSLWQPPSFLAWPHRSSLDELFREVRGNVVTGASGLAHTGDAELIADTKAFRRFGSFHLATIVLGLACSGAGAFVLQRVLGRCADEMPRHARFRAVLGSTTLGYLVALLAALPRHVLGYLAPLSSYDAVSGKHRVYPLQALAGVALLVALAYYPLAELVYGERVGHAWSSAWSGAWNSVWSAADDKPAPRRRGRPPKHRRGVDSIDRKSVVSMDSASSSTSDNEKPLTRTKSRKAIAERPAPVRTTRATKQYDLRKSPKKTAFTEMF